MKKTSNKEVTPQQIKALQTCFGQKGFNESDRHDFILSFTSGRTQSTKGLTFDEARAILEHLNTVDKKRIEADTKKLLRSIYHLSFHISFLNQGFDDKTEEDRQMNFAKINRFTRERGAFRKPITQMNLKELELTKRQFEALAHKEA